MTKNLVSIAGYDPSGGAGVLLDIGVFEQLGQRGFGVLTAVTAQNPGRVARVFPMAARAVTGQFGRLAEAVDIAGIKVGMLRLIVVWPFPEQRIFELAGRGKAFVMAEMNYGQLFYEVDRSARGKVPVILAGHGGGTVHDVEDIVSKIEEAGRCRS